MADPTSQTAALADGDLILVQRACAGERDAFLTLVGRYQNSLYRAALAIARNQADAEDIVQETFLRAFQHLDQFRGESKFQTWLTQIAINTARMRLRKEHAGLWESLDRPQETPDGQAPRDVIEWRENPEERLGRVEAERLLQQAMAGLPASYREVLALRDIQMLSTQEAAAALGLSIANVKTRLLRARLQLRDRLAPHFEATQRRSEQSAGAVSAGETPTQGGRGPVQPKAGGPITRKG